VGNLLITANVFSSWTIMDCTTTAPLVGFIHLLECCYSSRNKVDDPAAALLIYQMEKLVFRGGTFIWSDWTDWVHDT